MNIRPEYFPNPPRWRRGHNTSVPRRPTPTSAPCACGCGVNASPGKRFVTGHNGRGKVRAPETRAKISASRRGNLNPMFGRPAPNRVERPAAQPCACSCGKLATPGRRYISGHNSRGVRMQRYRGWMHHHGYIQVDARDHPFSDRDGYVLEHRLVVEEHLRATDPTSPHLITLGYKLYLDPAVVVHHIDGVKDNNELDNLVSLSPEEHALVHHAQGDIRG